MEILIGNKKCTKCGRIKPLESFVRASVRKDGRASSCKECEAKYRAGRKGEKRTYDAEQYIKNREKRIQYSADYRTENSEKAKSFKRCWYAKNPENIVYWSMYCRCYNPNYKNYRHYGGKGIKICERWLGIDGYKNFIEDMGLRPDGAYDIHRINNDGDYEPENCVWIERYEHLVLHNEKRRLSRRQ